MGRNKRNSSELNNKKERINKAKLLNQEKKWTKSTQSIKINNNL